MSDYEEVLDQARKLPLVDQARLVEELAILVRARIQAWPKHSVLEFEGLAKSYGRVLMLSNISRKSETPGKGSESRLVIKVTSQVGSGMI